MIDVQSYEPLFRIDSLDNAAIEIFLTETKMPSEKEAIDAVKKVTPDGRKFRVTGRVDNTFDGTLFIVEYDHEVNVWDEKFVVFNGGQVQVMASALELATEFSTWCRQPRIIRTIKFLVQPNVMTATLTIIIICTISAYTIMQTYYERDILIPQFLNTAVTAVLAFYFGSKISK